ncbi:MAG TPA: ATP-binding protein [Rubrivivax sp.]|nr:ATP-binding protein [Rubrivivax sp.]
MIAHLQFDISQGAAGIEAVRLGLLQRLAACELSTRSIYALELVLDEWLSNVARHSAAIDETSTVDIQVRVLAQALELRFEDRQPAFDPLSQPAPQRVLSLDDVRPGGLGLELIRTQTSSLHHERAGDRNVFVACIPRHPRGTAT